MLLLTFIKEDEDAISIWRAIIHGARSCLLKSLAILEFLVENNHNKEFFMLS